MYRAVGTLRVLHLFLLNILLPRSSRTLGCLPFLILITSFTVAKEPYRNIMVSSFFSYFLLHLLLPRSRIGTLGCLPLLILITSFSVAKEPYRNIRVSSFTHTSYFIYITVLLMRSRIGTYGYISRYSYFTIHLLFPRSRRNISAVSLYFYFIFHLLLPRRRRNVRVSPFIHSLLTKS